MKKRIISLLLTIPMLFTIGCSKNNKINESEENLEGKINSFVQSLNKMKTDFANATVTGNTTNDLTTNDRTVQ